MAARDEVAERLEEANWGQANREKDGVGCQSLPPEASIAELEEGELLEEFKRVATWRMRVRRETRWLSGKL